MSLFDMLKNAAGDLLGTVIAHETNANPSELADNIVKRIDSLDETSLINLGQQLLESFTRSDSYPSDGGQAADEAGTTAEAVASGSPNAIARLITFAKNHPQILQSISGSFAPLHDEEGTRQAALDRPLDAD
jgi:hypothetical protein